MTPEVHSSSNDVLGAPAGMPTGECDALAITQIVWSNGAQGVVSFWRPSEDELQLLNEGQPVRVSFAGAVTHPPFFVGVDGDGRMSFPPRGASN